MSWSEPTKRITLTTKSYIFYHMHLKCIWKQKHMNFQLTYSLLYVNFQHFYSVTFWISKR